MKKFKNLSLVIAFLMVLQILMPVNFAYAAGGNITKELKESISGSVKVIDPVTNEEISPTGGKYINIPTDAILNIKYNFELPSGDDYDFKKGDYFIINLPDEINFKTPLKNKILDKDDVLIATYESSAEGIKVTFTDYVEKHSKVYGGFNIEGTFKEESMGSGETKSVEFEYIATIDFTFEKDEIPDAGAKINKTGTYNSQTGLITWIVIVTPDGELENVSISDTFSNNQEYVDESFAVVTTACAIVVTGSALKVEGNIIKYDFGAISSEQKIQFNTKPKSNSFAAENENNDAVIFINDAKVYVNNKETDNAKASVKINWIEKSGTINRNDGTIEWTININNDGYSIENPTITDRIPNGLTFVEGSEEIITSNGALVSIEHIISGDTLRFNCTGTLTGQATLKYKTVVVNWDEYLKGNDAKNFENSASLSWKDNTYGSPSAADTVGVIGQGGILNKTAEAKKTYDDNTTDIIEWTVEVNRNKAELKGKITFSDVIPEELEYEGNDGDFVIVGHDYNDLGVLSYNKDTKTLMFEFKDDVVSEKTYTIKFKTKIVDKERLFYNDNNVQFSNTAVVSGSAITGKIAKGSGSQPFDSQVLSKSVKTAYNYETRIVEWQIIVNRNNLTLENAVLTDIIPDGMVYAGGFSVTPNTGTVSEGENKNPKIDENENKLTFNLGTISETHTVTFKTKVIDEKLFKQGDVTFTNKAELKADNFTNIPKAEATITVKNPIVSKTGKSEGDFVRWTVQINPNSVELDKVELSDELNAALTLDTDSVKLYTATPSAVNGTLIAGDIVPPDKYEFEYSKEENNIFIFRFKDQDGFYKINEPYILEFITGVEKNQTINNEITLKGEGIIGGEAGSKTSVTVSKDDSYGGGETGSITITKVDEFENKLSNAKFKIYNRDKYGSEKLIKEATTLDDGSVIFDNLLYKTYYIEETNAPEGYLRDDRIIVSIITDAETRSFQFVNTKIYGDIEFVKLNELNKPLAGSEFELFAKDESGKFTISKGTAISKEDGSVIFNHIEAGDYQVREIKSPTGYEVSTDTIDVNIGRDSSQTKVVVTLTINGKAMNSGLSNKLVNVFADVKVLKRGKAENNDAVLYDKVLEGAEFTLYDEEDVLVAGPVTSEISGEVTFSFIPEGKYVIRETKAPDGYLKSNEDIFVEVYRDTEKLDKALVSYSINSVVLQDEPVVYNNAINILLMKTDTSGNPLEGAEFTLYDEEGIKVEGFDSVTSNSFGEVVFTAVPVGNYIIKETRAPRGYRVYTEEIHAEVSVNENSDEEIVVFTIDGETVELEEGELFTVENEKRPGTGPTPVLGKIAIKKTGEDNKVLSGAEFTLYDEDGKAVGRGVTGSDGTLSFNDLKFGTYIIKETKAPDGYIIAKDETAVVINSAAAKTFTFTNEKEVPPEPTVPTVPTDPTIPTEPTAPTDPTDPSVILGDPNIPEGWEKIEDETLPDTGSFFSTWMIAVLGFILILAGIVLHNNRSIRKVCN